MFELAQQVFQRPDLAFAHMVPLIVVGVLMVLTLCFELKSEDPEKESSTLDVPGRPTSWLLSVLGLVGLVAWLLAGDNTVAGHTFNSMLADDGLARGAAVLIAACALLAILSGHDELQRFGNQHGGEFIALILAASVGMILMSSALNTIVMFLGLELFSIALYLLCIFFPNQSASRESGMKYFILSSAASAILLYGLAMLYGATGTTWLTDIAAQPQIDPSGLAIVGSVLVLIGLLFKLAVIPFHFWAPDVYVGAPTTVTAFMSVATKVAAMVALWRLFIITVPTYGELLLPILFAVSMMSMILGNLLAYVQTNVKRMLAYSGVANAGYLLIAPVVGPGMETPLFVFLASYLVANIGAFLALSVVERQLGGQVTREDLKGLARTQPGLAAVFALSLVSLAGLPPAGGFIGKFYLFGYAVSAGEVILPGLGIVCSLIGAAYYLGTALTLFDGGSKNSTGSNPSEVALTDSTEKEVEPVWTGTDLALALCAVGILLLGVFPVPFVNWVSQGFL